MGLKLFLVLTALLFSFVIACYFFYPKPDPLLPKASRIEGGMFASKRAFPHHVQYGDRCNGAIISLWWVIAPASCPNYTFVRVGSHYYNYGVKKYIRKKVVHNRYRSPDNTHMYEYDFQLMKFLRRIHDECAVPIPVSLATKKEIDFNTYLVVSGFGENEVEGGPPSTDLRSVTIQKQNDTTCRGPAYGHYSRNVTPRLMCAGAHKGLLGACKGDVGGGLIYNGALVGLLYVGRGCRPRDENSGIRIYSLYGLLSPVVDWIKKVTLHNVTYRPANVKNRLDMPSLSSFDQQYLKKHKKKNPFKDDTKIPYVTN